MSRKLFYKDSPVETIDGKPARVLCHNRVPWPYCLVVLIFHNGSEQIEFLRQDGKDYRDVQVLKERV